jgi:tetratricopeptide (TPR) repeat protein
MDALLAALPAGVACVTFLIGFANLRIHAERERAIQRTDEIAREITHTSGQAIVRDEDVEATSESFSEAMRIDPVARWTLYAASFVSLASVFLFGVQISVEGWTLDIDPAKWDHSFLPLLSMPVFTLVVTALGWADYTWVIHDLERRRSDSFMETVRKAMGLRRAGDYTGALREVETLTPKLDRWAWLFAFRSNCLEHVGRYEAATHLARKASSLTPENGWYLLQIARLLWEQNLQSEALEVADRVVAILPDEPSARGLRGVIYDRLGRDEDALADLEIALKDSPTDVELIKARGTSLVRSNVTDLSVRTIEQIVGEGDEIYVAALRARAHTRLKRRDLQQAIDDLNSVISANASDAEAISYRALAFALLDDVQSAEHDIASYEALPKTVSLEGLVEIGQSLFHIQRYGEALSKFTIYLEFKPESRIALHWRGMTYEELDQPTKAIEDYENHLKRNPEDAHFLAHHGSVMMDVGLKDAALRDLNEAVSLDGKSRYVRIVRGSILATLGQYQAAFDDFDQLVRRHSVDVTALVRRASMSFQLGRIDEALADLGAAERADANYARLYALRGLIYTAEERLSDAKQNLDRAIELNPSDWIALANRGITLDRLNLEDEAIEDYDKAILISPTVARLYVQRGCVYFRLGDKLKAIRDYNKALSVDPGNASALEHRADWYKDAGQQTEAIADLTRAYQEDPNDFSILGKLSDAHAKAGDSEKARLYGDKAIEGLTRAYEANSADMAVLDNLSAAYAKAGDSEKARFYADKAIEGLTRAYEGNPADLTVLDKLTVAYARAGDSEKAHFYAGKVWDVGSAQGKDVRSIAYGWNNEGLAAESSLIFKRLVDAGPDNIRNALAYAISLYQMDNTSDASRLLDEILVREGDDAVAEWGKLVIPNALYRYEDVTQAWQDALARIGRSPSS